MRRFLTLFGREVRDARWHLAGSLVVAGAAPWVLHGVFLEFVDDETVAAAGGRVLVPVLFGLFAAATASDLVSRDVATRRIDALAVLPVPVATLWRAKAAFLLAASLLFLAWTVGMEFAAVTATAREKAIALLTARLADAVPSLLAGVALAAVTLFFSTLLERGFAAVMAALVVVVALAWSIQIAEVPAASGAMTSFAACAVPLGIAAAFVAGSRAAFVRGPIHGPAKLRLVAAGVVASLAILVPGGAAVALGLERTTRLAPGDGDPAHREAYVSPDGKWIAVEDSTAPNASRTWILGVDDGSCREIAPGATWFEGAAWLPGSMLVVQTSSFSVLDGPRHVRQLEIEPTQLGVADEKWVRQAMDIGAPWSQRWAWQSEDRVLPDGRRLVTVGWYGGSRRFACRSVAVSPTTGVLFVVTEKGALTRVTTADDKSADLIADGVTSAKTSPDGVLLFVDTTSGTRIHSASTGATLVEHLDRLARPLGAGRRLLLWTEDASHAVTDFAVRDLDTQTTVELGAPRMSDRVPRVTWLADGRFVVCDGNVTLRDADGGTIRCLFPPDSKEK